MREAYFGTIFCGIETPDPVALKAMHKDHNMMVPILEGIQDHQPFRHGGRLRHHPRPRHRQTGNRGALLEFVDDSRIPLLTMNLLQALPKTPCGTG